MHQREVTRLVLVYNSTTPCALFGKRFITVGLATLWADKVPTSAQTASHVTHANWRPTEDVGDHDQARPGAPLRMVEKGLGESL